jgi:methyl-accepting chemotaxis protein
MPQRFSITAKIWLSVGIFILGFVISTVLGQVHGLTTENDLRSASNDLLPAVQRTQEADMSFQKMVKSFGIAVMTQDTSLLRQATQQGRNTVEFLHSVAATPALSAGEAERVTRLAASVEAYLYNAGSLYAAACANPTMTREGEEKMQSMAARTEEMKSAVEAEKAPVLQELNRHLDAIQARSRLQRYTAQLVFAITLLAAAVLVRIMVKRSIVTPILSAIRGVQRAAEEAASESERMARSGQKVAFDSRDQAISVKQTSAALDKISATATENAARADQADTLMKDARRRVDHASQSMDRLTASMDAISSSSKEVAQVLESIDEIAFHTNILALNAAVEAARAGDVGAGFGVVAGEVRSLAQRAAQAARRSADIVDRTIADIRNGVELVAAAHGTFVDVSTAIVRSSEVVARIAATSQDQSRGVKSISMAISRIQVVTKNNAEHALQTAESASQMAGQVETTRNYLAELVEVMGLGT